MNYEKRRATPTRALGLDGKGRLWLTYRQKFGTRYSTHPGSYWLTFARRLDGDHWTEPIEVHHSDGLLDSRPWCCRTPPAACSSSTTPTAATRRPNKIQNQIYRQLPRSARRPGRAEAGAARARQEGRQDVAEQGRGQEAVKRIRDYRIEAGGKKYQLLRGEFHRHTEISWDGGPDGSLEDMFRYAIDAAALDWIGNGDHDNGAGREYPWWLTQKFDRRLPRRRPLHAAVQLRAQRRLSARPSQLHVRPARRPHPAAPGRAGPGQARSPASTPTTPRCFTDT